MPPPKTTIKKKTCSNCGLPVETFLSKWIVKFVSITGAASQPVVKPFHGQISESLSKMISHWPFLLSPATLWRPKTSTGSNLDLTKATKKKKKKKADPLKCLAGDPQSILALLNWAWRVERSWSWWRVTGCVSRQTLCSSVSCADWSPRIGKPFSRSVQEEAHLRFQAGPWQSWKRWREDKQMLQKHRQHISEQFVCLHQAK